MQSLENQEQRDERQSWSDAISIPECRRMDLQIDVVDDDSAISLELHALRDVCFSKREPIYLDDGFANVRLIGRLPEHEGIVGVCSLRQYRKQGSHVLSLLVHPDYEGRGIATALTEAAIAYGKEAENVSALFARTNAGTTSDRIISRLGFVFSREFAPRGSELVYREYRMPLESEAQPLPFGSEHLFTKPWVTQLMKQGGRGVSYMTVHEEYIGTPDMLERMRNYFSERYAYPRCSQYVEDMIEQIDRRTDPAIHGFNGKVALNGQSVYWRCSEDRQHLAVYKPFVRFPEAYHLTLYELERGSSSAAILPAVFDASTD